MRGQAMGALALVAAVALGAAGCGEDSPKPGPVTGSSTSRPKISAEDFTREFIKTLNLSSTSLETSKWRSMFTSGCVYCERIADQLDSIKTNGGDFKAEPWTIQSVVVSSTAKDAATTSAVVSIPPQQVRYRAGGRTETFEGETKASRRFELQRRGSTWVVANFGSGSQS